MGLFDQVLSAASSFSNQQESGSGDLLGSVMQLLNSPQIGGISGLVATLESGGLGEVVRSWVSTGQNLPISAEQIQGVLGNEQISHLASQLGIDPAQASVQLAQYLPQVVDHLTPDGNVPEGDLMSQGLSLLRGKLFG